MSAGRHPHPNDPDHDPYADELLHDWDRDDEVTPEAPDDGRDLRDPAPIGDPWALTVTCPDCRGAGWRDGDPCSRCHEGGWLLKAELTDTEITADRNAA